MPGIPASPASRNLLLAEEHRAFRFAAHRRFRRGRIRGGDPEKMLNATTKDISAKHWRKNFRQQKIRNSLELIPRGWSPGDIHAQVAQLLDQSPYFGPAGANFVGDFRSAH